MKGMGVCLGIYTLCVYINKSCGSNWLKCTSQITATTAQAIRVILLARSHLVAAVGSDRRTVRRQFYAGPRKY